MASVHQTWLKKTIGTTLAATCALTMLPVFAGAAGEDGITTANVNLRKGATTASVCRQKDATSCFWTKRTDITKHRRNVRSTTRRKVNATADRTVCPIL